MRVEPGAASRNMAHALELIAQAASERSGMVLLPEALPFGWMDPATKNAEEIPDGQYSSAFREAAVRHRLFVCTGLVEKSNERIFNSAVLIGPDGEVLLHHRKIHELDIAHDTYALGDRLGVADTPFGRVGLMVCADGFAPGQMITRTLGLMGARLILSPCAWAVPPEHNNTETPYGQLWLDNYSPVARDFNLSIAGCSNVGPIPSGPWSGHRCIGCSLVVGPDGRPRLRGPYGESAEAILFCDLEIAERTSRVFFSGTLP
jgi:predicted amidohydrolase